MGPSPDPREQGGVKGQGFDDSGSPLGDRQLRPPDDDPGAGELGELQAFIPHRPPVAWEARSRMPALTVSILIHRGIRAPRAGRRTARSPRAPTTPSAIFFLSPISQNRISLALSLIQMYYFVASFKVGRHLNILFGLLPLAFLLLDGLKIGRIPAAAREGRSSSPAWRHGISRPPSW